MQRDHANNKDSKDKNDFELTKMGTKKIRIMFVSDHFYWTVIAGFFIWSTTIFGTAFVFFITEEQQNKIMLDTTLGVAAGFMVAASVWSLLIPAIEKSASYEEFAWVPVCVGFFLGCAFIFIVDKLIPMPTGKQLEEIMTSTLELEDNTSASPTPSQLSLGRRWKRIVMLIIAITVHNMPESMAVGLAFGAIGSSPSATFPNAISLTIGIGIQNMPEGLVVSIPLVSVGWSKWRSFIYGCLTGIVEPFFAVVGYFVVLWVTPILPYLLSFAAGAMIHVTVHDVIPEANMSRNGSWATWGFNIGFIIMMALEVSKPVYQRWQQSRCQKPQIQKLFSIYNQKETNS